MRPAARLPSNPFFPLLPLPPWFPNFSTLFLSFTYNPKPSIFPISLIFTLLDNSEAYFDTAVHILLQETPQSRMTSVHVT